MDDFLLEVPYILAYKSHSFNRFLVFFSLDPKIKIRSRENQIIFTKSHKNIRGGNSIESVIYTQLHTALIVILFANEEKITHL